MLKNRTNFLAPFFIAPRRRRSESVIAPEDTPGDIVRRRHYKALLDDGWVWQTNCSSREEDLFDVDDHYRSKGVETYFSQMAFREDGTEDPNLYALFTRKPSS